MTGRLCAAVAVAAAALAAMLLWPASSHEEPHGRFACVADVCIVDYPEYRELMARGEVTVTDGDLTVRLVKGELDAGYLRALGTMVRAE